MVWRNAVRFLQWLFILSFPASKCNAVLHTEVSQGDNGAGRGNSCGQAVYTSKRYPYIVSLRNYGGSHICAGILVHSQYVLTAKHCLEELGLNFLVFIGPYSMNKHEQNINITVRIEETFEHSIFDAALGRLPMPIYGIPIPQLAGPIHTMRLGQQVVAVGLVDDLDQSQLKVLRFVDELEVVENERCAVADPIYSIKDEEFCTWVKGTSGHICDGYSGGAVLLSEGQYSDKSTIINPEPDVIFGLISRASNQFGSHVRMTSLYGWIKEITQETNISNFPEGTNTGMPGNESSDVFRRTSPWPSIASIRMPGSREHACSGQLIDNRHVLTLATCIDPKLDYTAGFRPIVYIRGRNTNDHGDNVKKVAVNETFIHEEYKTNPAKRSPYNVAILRLKEEVDIHAPPLLNNHVDFSSPGIHLSTLGWEKDREKAHDESYRDLTLENVMYVETATCNHRNQWNGTINQNMLCTLNQEKMASCTVDDGAPLVLLNNQIQHVGEANPMEAFIVGLNVDGKACKTKGMPDIYIDVRSLTTWIKSKIYMP